MADISSEGWAGVNAQPTETPIYSETEQAQLDKDLAKVFSGKAGKNVMAWLRESNLTTPTWAPGYATDYGFFREGQNTLIREFESRIERAKQNG